MSPDPPHVVETERVQRPLTLSKTCTWPEAPYWLNHPTSRSPARTGSLSTMVSDRWGEPVEAAAPWMTSGDATGAATERDADGAGCSTASSEALTEYVE